RRRGTGGPASSGSAPSPGTGPPPRRRRRRRGSCREPCTPSVAPPSDSSATAPRARRPGDPEIAPEPRVVSAHDAEDDFPDSVGIEELAHRADPPALHLEERA